jgi:hypothetical protein
MQGCDLIQRGGLLPDYDEAMAVRECVCVALCLFTFIMLFVPLF